MVGRSPARFLAPIALVAVVIAFVTVISGGSPSPSSRTTSGSSSATPTASAKKSAKKASRKARKTYVVKAGDTPSGIAQEAGIPLQKLLELNPDLDPQSLTVGQRLKLQ